ncbi:MAG: hypothetical protein HXY25_13305, partial [Alphaproteobacteria bacterium]|nr:hypothetical protein [Alphaproteobacteria bacterium]
MTDRSVPTAGPEGLLPREGTLFLDLTRLQVRLQRPVPTGIDRIELAVARAALAREPGRTHFVVFSAGRPVLLPRGLAAETVGTLARR